MDGSRGQLGIDGVHDVCNPGGGRGWRRRPFLLAFLLALAGLSAAPAWAAGAKAVPALACSSPTSLSVTFTMSGFPNAPNNTVTETVKVDGVVAYKGKFVLNGPSATNTVTIKLSPGPHAIKIHVGWNTNGVKGETDRNFVGFACPQAEPASGPLSAGYWKNHLSSGSPNTNQYLPQYIAAYIVDSTEKAYAIFTAMNCADSTSQAAIGCLVGQLLASELNLANGSPNCIAPVVSKANSWLAGNTQDGVPGVVYAGPSVTYTLTQAQRDEAIALKDQFAKYNTEHGC